MFGERKRRKRRQPGDRRRLTVCVYHGAGRYDNVGSGGTRRAGGQLTSGHLEEFLS